MEDTAAAVTDDQEQPGCGSQGDDPDLDFISRLPDVVLGTVVSLLPTRDGARTQGISRRWRPLWRSPMTPLNLATNGLLRDKQPRATRLSEILSENELRVALISKILSDHQGPSCRFSFGLVFLTDLLPEIDGWFSSAPLAGLQELEITNLQMYRYHYPLPPHAVTRFSPTLRLLKLGSCRVPDLVTPLRFPLLEQLSLFNVGISEDTLHSIISGCAVLKSFSLRGLGLGRICISSPTLRSISFCVSHSKGVTFQELVIEDAPSLESLLPIFPGNGPWTIRVIRAPRLQILGFLSEGISALHLGTTVFQKMIAVSLTSKMHAMKILALGSIGANLNAVVGFLKCFPLLEKLYVIFDHGKGMTDVLKYDPLYPIECFELHLKKVVLKNYNGYRRPCIDFAKFFILNAKVLKEMEIGVLNRESDTWMCDQRSQLQLENRASQDAQIALRRDGYSIPSDHGHTHDLSMADPFEKSMCCFKCQT